MLGEISAFLSSVGAAKEIGSALVGERDREKLLALKLEFLEQLVDLGQKTVDIQNTMFEKDARIRELLETVSDLQRRKSEEDRYVLQNLGTGGIEFFAYALRPAAELADRKDEAPHFLCQPCFNAGKKSVLISNGDGHWRCSACGNGVQAGPARPTPSPRAHDYNPTDANWMDR